MNAIELANQSLMTEDEAQMLLDLTKDMVGWPPMFLIDLSLHGFQANEIADKLKNDPMLLQRYLLQIHITEQAQRK